MPIQTFGLGSALLALLTTLWYALAYGSGVEQVRSNLEWYVGISAIVCLFLGGLLASAIGGAIGGAVTKPANADLAVTTPITERDTRVVVDDDDREPQVTRVS